MADAHRLVDSARIGDMEKLEVELAKGARQEIRDDRGFCALMAAAMNGHEAIVERLLGIGFDPNALSTKPRLSPGEVAVAYGRAGVLARLVAAGGRMEPGSGACSLLAYAVSRAQPECVEILISSGADVSEAALGPLTPANTPLVRSSMGRFQLCKDLVSASRSELEREALEACSNKGGARLGAAKRV